MRSMFPMRQVATKAMKQQQRFLSVHEYQAKDIMRKHGLCVEEGYMAETLEQANAAIDKIGTKLKVVKSQILAGGRGRGTFDTGFEVCEVCSQILLA